MDSKIARDVYFLKCYAGVLTIVCGVLLLTGFRSNHRKVFAEIDVERINVVEPDGKVDLVITNASRFPPPILNGRTMKRSGESGHGVPGLVFYNREGNEQGGLVWSGRSRDGKYTAGAMLAFDQFNHDQTVAISYDDDNGLRSAGMKVWDHPDDSLADLYDRSEEVQKMEPGPKRDAAAKKLSEDWGAQRVFLGKQSDRSAVLLLADAKGRARIKMTVDAAGNPKVELLDENGKTTYSLPPPDPDGRSRAGSE
ncbi:MAG TPA: hypothetical protein VLE48_12720 [Terriglobales bacterium]|nr:hypothetical protein [Terriglobales bacterium]